MNYVPVPADIVDVLAAAAFRKMRILSSVAWRLSLVFWGQLGIDLNESSVTFDHTKERG